MGQQVANRNELKIFYYKMVLCENMKECSQAALEEGYRENLWEHTYLNKTDQLSTLRQNNQTSGHDKRKTSKKPRETRVPPKKVANNANATQGAIR